MYGVTTLHKGNGTGSFYDVLPKELTLDRALPYPLDYSHRTLFKEVKIKIYEEKPEVTNLVNELDEIKPVKHKGNWQKIIFDKFCEIVERNFTDNVIVSHSSGYDSRMISLAITSRGLKPVEYCESLGEHDGFKAIMKYLKIKNYRIFGEDLSPGQHSFPFISDAAHGFDGVVGLHLNPFFTPYKDHYITQFTGCGSNTMTQSLKVTQFEGLRANGLTESLKADSNYFTKASGITGYMKTGQKIRKHLRFINYTHLSKNRIMGDAIHPFHDFDFIRTIVKIRNWQTNKERFSKQILDKVSPDISRIKREDVASLVARGYRTVDDNILREIVKKYESTWYGKRVKSTPTNRLEYHQFWADWGASQICEKLIGKGFDIKF